MKCYKITGRNYDETIESGLLIEVIEEEPQQGASVPVEEKVEEFLLAKVIACAEDCTRDLTGKTVVFHSFGKEEVKEKAKVYFYRRKSPCLCRIDYEKDTQRVEKVFERVRI